MATVTVDAHAGGVEVIGLSPASPFLFGRGSADGVTGLDPSDAGISRLAGAVVLDGTTCTVRNLSQRRPIGIETSALLGQATLAPGGAFTVTTDSATIVVTGEIRRHSLVLGGLRPDERGGVPAVDPPDGARTHAPGSLFTSLEHEAAIAFCAPLLLAFPRRSTRPNSYDDAAAMLASTSTSVRKALERVRSKLAAFDVCGVDNPSDLANYLVFVGAVRPSDLADLGDRRRRAP